MKNSKKFMMMGMMMVLMLVLVSMFVVGGGVFMQGKLSVADQLISVSVSPFSPSGQKTVSPGDLPAIYELCASKKRDVRLGSIGIDFTSRTDSLDPDSFNSGGYFVVKAAGIAGSLTDGNYKINNSSTGLISTVALFKEQLVIEKGACKTISLFVDTQSLMNEKPGSNDNLTVKLVKLYALTNGTGNVSSNAPVPANLLNY